MALVETQQLRMLEQLRHAGKQPMTLDQLRAGGIDFPAVVIGELELNGSVIERAYEHRRLLGIAPARDRSPRPINHTLAPPMAPTFAIAHRASHIALQHLRHRPASGPPSRKGGLGFRRGAPASDRLRTFA